MDYIHYQPTADNYTSEDSEDDMDLETTAMEYGAVEMILDYDGMQKAQEVQMEEVVNDLAEDMELVSIKTTRKNKNWGPSNVERLTHVMQEEGLSVPKAAEVAGIPRSTAYGLVNEFNASDGTVLSGSNPRKTNNKAKKLFPEHSAF
ncbi:hypothetical protein HPULCUR_012107 [Helicostylum pulchrum]|uniref:Uncharacterized protein n=1 Tax=Helicostylum pulchrum TaxID=562976 RepID=A0ABP9YI88_9FUNG